MAKGRQNKKTYKPKYTKNWKKKRASKFRLTSLSNTKYGVHYFKRTLNASGATYNINVDGAVWKNVTSQNYFNINTNGTAIGTKCIGAATLNFSLEHLPNVSEYTSMFDQYRINKCVVRIMPYNTSSDMGTTVYPQVSPILYWHIDHDDVTLPSSSESGLGEFRQCFNYKWRRLVAGKAINIVVKPRPLMNALGADNSVNINTKKMGAWYDCAHTNVKFYGLKLMTSLIQPVGAATYNVPLDIQVTYYCSFKGSR